MQIYLIGFMGTGKTTTGRKLSKLTGKKLLDTDELIVEQEGRSISQIFAEDGEAGFREIETGVFKKLSTEEKEYIISCGGGAPLRETNVSYMKKNGVVIRLTATAETVYERVKNNTSRPLLKSPDPMQRIVSLMGEREEAYSSAADITIKTDGKTPDQVASEILSTLTK
ncbi:MAG TPA: shikimate kinase [Lachnospiraceae bacterium]|jgi:shikimate kinase|nr:shikimate kinase [Lachnospiraceae bacterium]MDD7665138.1 shikimate kinase [Lachnospiraceae bacterium]MDY4164081.1 shikimate kinase [Lachnospiraceae bacterium]HAP02831.1 shikimate kinase [Lachnospiraceae bacterium]